MKRYKWLVMFVVFLCLNVAGSALAANCSEIKKNLQQERNLQKKRKLIGDAIVQCPQDPVINFSYALSLERFKKYEKALFHYQRAVAAAPEMAKAYAGMGDVYIHLGLLDEAVAVYEKAVQYKPTSKRFKGRSSRLQIKQKALKGEVVSASEFVKVMDNKGKIPSGMSLLLTGPVLQYKIIFVENSNVLDTIGNEQLYALGQAIQNDALREIRFEISTFVNSGLSAKLAFENSKVRAKLIKEQLVINFQIDPKRIEIVWYGDSLPLDTGGLAGEVTRNERVEIRRIVE